MFAMQFFSAVNVVFLVALTILNASTASADNITRESVRYTPSVNGYELNIPFASKFINCYGEVHVTISRNSKKITSGAYIYEGKRYTASELGQAAFQKISVGLTDITADVYHGPARLGNIKMENVIDWLGGCFGQTYHAMGLLNLSDKDYKNKIDGLYLKNIKILQAYAENPSLERRIKEMLKEEKASRTIEQADRELAAGNLNDAKRLYKDAIRMGTKSTAHVNKMLAKIDSKLKLKKNQALFDKRVEDAEKLFSDGDYDAAKAKYEEALKLFPDDERIRKKIKAIEKLLNKEKAAQRNKKAAMAAAANRKHKGKFWGINYGSDSSGTATQAAGLLGNFRLDYDMWTLAGEPAHRFRFYWEWADALNTGYPQWVSVLGNDVVMIKDLEKYPDLMERWNQIKPEYVELEVDILNYTSKGKSIVGTGRMKVIPEVIGRSGQEVDWSRPSSPDWDELFPYCNQMGWSHFRELGLYEEISDYANKYGNEVAWPKYAFEQSDKINFFQGFKVFNSRYKSLSQDDYNNFSSTADITRIIWPTETILSIIKEYKDRERYKKEEKMDAKDFWNTPENAEANQGNFWETPEDTTTKDDMQRKYSREKDLRIVRNRTSTISRQREKYSALQHPFEIAYPQAGSVHKKNVVHIKGSINKYFLKNSKDVYLDLNGVRQQVDVSSDGRFTNAIVLSNGKNDIILKYEGYGFSAVQPLSIYYDGINTDIRVTLTWNTGRSDLDLYVRDPQDAVVYYSAKTANNMRLDVDDTDGYGPENVSVINGIPGRYPIEVKNYSSGRGTEAKIYIYLHEKLIRTESHIFRRSKEIWKVEPVNLK